MDRRTDTRITTVFVLVLILFSILAFRCSTDDVESIVDRLGQQAEIRAKQDEIQKRFDEANSRGEVDDLSQ